MEELLGSRFDNIGNNIRKRRTQISRRPRPESLQLSETHDHSPFPSTPPSDDLSKVSSEENTGGETNSRRKELFLNHCALRGSGSLCTLKKINDGNEGLEDSFGQGVSGSNHRWCSEGLLAPASWQNGSKTKDRLELLSTTPDVHGGRNGACQSSGLPRVNGDGGSIDKVKKVKLTVGGVTRMIQTNSNSHDSTRSLRTSDAPRSRSKLILQNDSDGGHSPPLKNIGMRGIPWKDFSRGNYTFGKEDLLMGKMPKKTASGNQGEKSEPARKSKRAAKRRVSDGAFDEEDEDNEIRYLQKLKITKVGVGRKDFEEESKKKQRLSRFSKNGNHGGISEDYVSSRSSKDGKKSQPERGSEDTDYEEEEQVCDGELEDKKKKPRNDSTDSPIESKRELALTTRQRALLSSKDVSSASSANSIEFPNGLPPAPPRKQKEKLSEGEQQLKKAEAAQRRRMQVEQAARESEAEAIRKILGQDSSRKKREDKIKKRQEELAQEKAANSLMLASSTIRWVLGPAGTVVTFPKDMGFPTIFDPKPCSYPSPREKCAGPSCTNPYKYRDSKSKLPLCSLRCYKAVNEMMSAETI